MYLWEALEIPRESMFFDEKQCHVSGYTGKPGEIYIIKFVTFSLPFYNSEQRI